MAIDMKVFLKNRESFPLEELEKYSGQWVAWSPDGTRIVTASAESQEAVYQMLEQAGLDLSEHVMSYVDDMGTFGYFVDASIDEEETTSPEE